MASETYRPLPVDGRVAALLAGKTDGVELLNSIHSYGLSRDARGASSLRIEMYVTNEEVAALTGDAEPREEE